RGDVRRVRGAVRVLKLGPDLSPARVERGGADQGAARRAVPHALATARELRDPAAGVPRAARVRAGRAVAAWQGGRRARRAGEHEGRLRTVKVNVDDSPGVAGHYGIMSIPALVFFKDGREVGRVIGAVPKARLARAVEQVLGAPETSR